MIEIELHGTRFEVTDPFGEPQVVIHDAATGYRGSYTADPRTDGRWCGDGGREVINPASREDLDIALAAARERAGAESFARGERYLLVLRGGDTVIGRCEGPYRAQAPSILVDTEDGPLAVMLRTIRTAIHESTTTERQDAEAKALGAVRARFSCGHTGGVWPEGASVGSAHVCLECGETVSVVTVIRRT